MGDTYQADEQAAERTDGRDRISELMDVLSDHRRRYIVYCLHHAATPMPVADVTDEIVRRELDTKPTNVPDVREQTYVGLYHNQLPKLATADIITFNKDEALIDLGSNADELQPYLEQLCDEEWPPTTAR